jgi:gamma-glutamylcyclotransferase (GGCT)/AIG2-like uncharacterized protein YtfP
MKEACDRLFVYGTLQPHYANHWARKLWDNSEDLGPATIAGRVATRKSFFVLLPPEKPDDVVPGQLARVNSHTILAELDLYEGPDYRRELRRVTRASGETVDAWVYLPSS